MQLKDTEFFKSITNRLINPIQKATRNYPCSSPLLIGEQNILPKLTTAYFNYPNSEYYCKNLQYAATEFQIQGLELDTVIIHWDEDLFGRVDNGNVSTKNHVLKPTTNENQCLSFTINE